VTNRLCHNCGAPLVGDTHTCEYCGADWTPAALKAARTPRTSRLAILSFVLSLCAFFGNSTHGRAPLYAAMALVAAVAGALSLRRIRRAPDQVGGDLLAIAGIVLGMVALLIAMILAGMEYHNYDYWREFFGLNAAGR